MSKNADRFVWLIIGVAVGAGIALLYAPKTGKDTRRYLARRTERAREALMETGEDLVDRGREIGEEIVERGREIYKKGVQIAEDATELLERGRRLVRG